MYSTSQKQVADAAAIADASNNFFRARPPRARFGRPPRGGVPDTSTEAIFKRRLGARETSGRRFRGFRAAARRRGSRPPLRPAPGAARPPRPARRCGAAVSPARRPRAPRGPGRLDRGFARARSGGGRIARGPRAGRRRRRARGPHPAGSRDARARAARRRPGRRGRRARRSAPGRGAGGRVRPKGRARGDGGARARLYHKSLRPMPLPSPRKSARAFPGAGEVVEGLRAPRALATGRVARAGGGAGERVVDAREAVRGVAADRPRQGERRRRRGDARAAPAGGRARASRPRVGARPPRPPLFSSNQPIPSIKPARRDSRGRGASASRRPRKRVRRGRVSPPVARIDRVKFEAIAILQWLLGASRDRSGSGSMRTTSSRAASRPRAT